MTSVRTYCAMKIQGGKETGEKLIQVLVSVCFLEKSEEVAKV